jgi:hypothetical protein
MGTYVLLLLYTYRGRGEEKSPLLVVDIVEGENLRMLGLIILDQP